MFGHEFGQGGLNIMKICVVVILPEYAPKGGFANLAHKRADQTSHICMGGRCGGHSLNDSNDAANSLLKPLHVGRIFIVDPQQRTKCLLYRAINIMASDAEGETY